MRRFLSSIGFGLVIHLAAFAADSELTNYKTGINVHWGDSASTAADKGSGYQEEYWFHDKIINDTKTVYLRSSTSISMSHNARNMGAVSLTNGQGTRTRTLIGANGIDNVSGNVTLTGATVSAATDIITLAGHGLVDGQSVLFISGTGWGPQTGSTSFPQPSRWYVTNATADTFQVTFNFASGWAAKDFVQDGTAGVFLSGDEGVIRYSLDKLWRNTSQHWAYGPWAGRKPIYSGPFALDSVEYETGVAVVGTTGARPGYLQTDTTNFYWRGLTETVGTGTEEYHVLMVADDDAALKGADDALASDGKYILLCVNPKTPALTVRATGDGQFYTTPIWTYWVPKIHNQTTYIQSSTGTVSFELRNIYGTNISYRINGGTTVNVDASSVTLSASDFPNTGAGTPNTLEYWYTATPAVVRTRTIVKNPGFPSAGETHGDRFTTAAYWTAAQARMGTTPYSTELARMNSSNARDYSTWLTLQRQGYRFGGSNWQFQQDYGVSDAFLAKYLGFSARLSGAPLTYAEAAKAKLMESALNQHVVGYEAPAWASLPLPCGDVVYRGYWDAYMARDSAIAYDILISGYRSDQVAGGITPIEDYFIRDRLAEWVHLCFIQIGGFCVPTDAGMWPTARNVGAMAITCVMPNYSTPYFGTSGMNGNTTTYNYAPYQGVNYTWRDVFVERSNVLGAYPTTTKIHFGMEGSSSTDALLRYPATFTKVMTGVTANDTTNIITAATHGMRIGEPFVLNSGNGFGGLTPGTTYYVASTSWAQNTLTAATSYANALAGTIIDITSAGTGGQITYYIPDDVWGNRNAYGTLSQMGQWITLYSNLTYIYNPDADRTIIDHFIDVGTSNPSASPIYRRGGVYSNQITGGESYGPEWRPYLNLMNSRHPTAAANANAAIQALSTTDPAVKGDSPKEQIMFNVLAMLGEYDSGAFGAGGADTTNPTISITTPTSSPTYDAGTSATVTLSGPVADDVGVSSVTWINSLGGSGTATYNAGAGTWEAIVPLVVGTNGITAAVTDTSGNPATAQLSVTRSAPVSNPVPDLNVDSATIQVITVTP